MSRAGPALIVVCALYGCGSNEDAGPAHGGAGSGGSGALGGAGQGGSGATSGAAGGSAAADAGPRRSFRLGFTPFAYDASQAALDFTYAKLNSDADLFAFHTTEGVPWLEAAQDLPFDAYGQALKDKWTQQKAHVTTDHAVYVALTPLDRPTRAPAWRAGFRSPTPGHGFSPSWSCHCSVQGLDPVAAIPPRAFPLSPRTIRAPAEPPGRALRPPVPQPASVLWIPVPSKAARSGARRRALWIPVPSKAARSAACRAERRSCRCRPLAIAWNSRRVPSSLPSSNVPPSS